MRTETERAGDIFRDIEDEVNYRRRLRTFARRAWLFGLFSFVVGWALGAFAGPSC